MQIGLTWPLQRLLRTTVPYGEAISRLYCWDMHCIELHGRSSLLLVHCASRYTSVRFDMTPLDWKRLPEIAVEEIKHGLIDAGLELEVVNHYFAAAGDPVLTRTHGRREIAFLNRAWEDVLSADVLIDFSHQRQPVLNYSINDLLCRCAEFDGMGTAREFLRRCFAA